MLSPAYDLYFTVGSLELSHKKRDESKTNQSDERALPTYEAVFRTNTVQSWSPCNRSATSLALVRKLMMIRLLPMTHDRRGARLHCTRSPGALACFSLRGDHALAQHLQS